MKLNTFNLVITIIFAALSTANACEKTVMGGCVVVETHDTSSHMKSQIVNQVMHPAATQAINATKTNHNSKQTKSSGGLIQAINKTVLK